MTVPTPGPDGVINSDDDSIYTDWITPEHLRHIADVVDAMNAAEDASLNRGGVVVGFALSFAGAIECIAGGEGDPGDGNLIGHIRAIDYPGAWAFVPLVPHHTWDAVDRKWTPIDRTPPEGANDDDADPDR